MSTKNGHTYRVGVPETEAVGNGADPNRVWRAYSKETGAYLGVVSREAPSVVAARKRAAELYGVPEDDVLIGMVNR